MFLSDQFTKNTTQYISNYIFFYIEKVLFNFSSNFDDTRVINLITALRAAERNVMKILSYSKKKKIHQIKLFWMLKLKFFFDYAQLTPSSAFHSFFISKMEKIFTFYMQASRNSRTNCMHIYFTQKMVINFQKSTLCAKLFQFQTSYISMKMKARVKDYCYDGFNI